MEKISGCETYLGNFSTMGNGHINRVIFTFKLMKISYYFGNSGNFDLLGRQCGRSTLAPVGRDILISEASAHQVYQYSLSTTDGHQQQDLSAK